MQLSEIVDQSNSPAILYHYTWPENRESILQYGLLVNKSQTEGQEIYLASKLRADTNGDIWQVHARGLDLNQTLTPDDDEDTWWVVYDDIPPDRLRLIKAPDNT